MSGVDVLAVIDRDRGDAHSYRCGQFKTAEVIKREGESVEARAAVAELLSALDAYEIPTHPTLPRVRRLRAAINACRGVA